MKLIVGIVLVLLGSLLSAAGALDEGKKDGSAEANSRQNALMVLAGLVIQLFAIVEAWW